MQVPEVLSTPSRLRIIQTKSSNQKETPRRLWRSSQFFPTITAQYVNQLRRTLGNLHNLRGFCRVCPHFVGSIETDNCLKRQQISHPFVSDRSYSTIFVDGSVNTAAVFLSRLELKVTEKIRLKLWENVETTHIELTTSPSDFADESNSTSRKQMTQMRSRSILLNGKYNPEIRQQIGY